MPVTSPRTIATWEDIPGWFNFQDVYDQAVAEAREGDTLVEVGSYLGKSTAYMAQKIRESGKTVNFFAVDAWPETDWQAYLFRTDDPPSPQIGETEMRYWTDSLHLAFLRAMLQCGVWHPVDRHTVRPVWSTSPSAAKYFDAKSLSFVFIDADHSYESVKADIAAWLPKVRAGGLIAGHDYGIDLWPGVKQAVDEAFGERVEKRGDSWVVRVP
jgi:hypothetical protein